MLKKQKEIHNTQTSRHHSHVKLLQLDFELDHRDKGFWCTGCHYQLPRKGVWVCHSPQIFALWDKHCKEAVQPA